MSTKRMKIENDPNGNGEKQKEAEPESSENVNHGDKALTKKHLDGDDDDNNSSSDLFDKLRDQNKKAIQERGDMIHFAPFLDLPPTYEKKYQYCEWKVVFVHEKDGKFYRFGNEDFELESDVVQEFDQQNNCFDLLLRGKKFLLYYSDPFEFRFDIDTANVEQYLAKNAYILQTNTNKKYNLNTCIIMRGTLSKKEHRKDENNKFSVIRFEPMLKSSDNSIYQYINIKADNFSESVNCERYEYDPATKSTTIFKHDELKTVYEKIKNSDILVCCSNFYLKVDPNRYGNANVFLYANLTHVVHFKRT